MKILDQAGEFFRFLGKWLPGIFRLLALRFDRSPFKTVGAVEEFVRTRSSYIAQTALFGYLKARMGTQFRVLFEDDIFSREIRRAAARLFGSCLADLTFHVVCRCRLAGRMTDTDAAAMATHLFESGLELGLADYPDENDMVRTEAITRFNQRLVCVNWPAAEDVEVTFASSESDLVRFAPVVDEFKELDREIVMNSIRFRWRDVREQARRRLDDQSVARDWLEMSSRRL